MRMKTLDQIITDAAQHISANRSLLWDIDSAVVVAQLKEIIRHAIEEAFDSRLHAEMVAQDAWWDEQEALAQQDEGRMAPETVSVHVPEEGWIDEEGEWATVEPDPDEKADPDCPEEFGHA